MASGERDGIPVLWHLKVSHYNEKARWALDYKRIPRARLAAARATYPAIRRRVSSMFGIDDARVELALARCRAAMERFSAELQPNGYLVGRGFTVADLTVAALLAPLVAPPQFPYPQPQ